MSDTVITLPRNAIATIQTTRLGFVATIGADGHPCVSPKGTFVVIDASTIAFGDIRSPGTIANLTANPAVEVNFVDQFKRKGARIRGRAEISDRGAAEFDRLIPHFHDIWGDLAGRIKAIVAIRVSAVSPLTTPPYDDGATEEEMIALYKSKFAELYP